MKEPKRVLKAIKTLEELKECFQFFASEDAYKVFSEKLSELEELLSELALDQKTQNARLAKRLKSLWKSEEE